MLKDSYCGPFLLSLVMDLFWSKKICSLKFLLYKARNSHILSFLHSFYALLLSSRFFFSFPYSRACLFHFQFLILWISFLNEIFIWSCWGTGQGTRQNTKHAMEVIFFPLSCHILWENTRLCLKEAEILPRLSKETNPQPWKSHLSQIWMKTRSSLASYRRMGSTDF